jgi:uncharacterized protein (DUF2252 family)
MTNQIVSRIESFNAGRNPELLAQKYQNMRSDVFTFYRGTCHLFYEDFPENSPLNSAPLAWICGDLHLENFGSYKGDNRLVYFDINDFDEAVLAPCTWDIVRFVTSIIVGDRALGIDESAAVKLGQQYLNIYSNTLANGQARTVEKETAKGLVKDLLDSLEKRKRPEFLDRYTKVKRDRRNLTPIKGHIAPATTAQQERVKQLIEIWQASHQSDPEFFRVLDVQIRIAGTGSLGLDRYIILVEGKGSPDGNYLLDLKETQISSLAPYLNVTQPEWESNSARVINIQQRVQGTPPALLGIVVDGNKSYALRELQPTQDKVDLKTGDGKIGRLERLIQTMGEITAWGQLRSGGRQGSAIADNFIDFAHSADWRQETLDYAHSYAKRVKQDFDEFCQGTERKN